MVVTLDMGLEGELNSITDLSSHTHTHTHKVILSRHPFLKTGMYYFSKLVCTTFSEELVFCDMLCTITKLKKKYKY